LNEIPESSASYLDIAVNVYLVVNEWDVEYHFGFNTILSQYE